MDPVDHLLAFNIAGYALGGVMVGAIVLDRWWSQVALSLLLSTSIYLLFQSDAAISSLFPVVGGDFLPFAAIALVTLGFTRLVFAVLPRARTVLAGVLRPQDGPPSRRRPSPAPTGSNAGS